MMGHHGVTVAAAAPPVLPSEANNSPSESKDSGSETELFSSNNDAPLDPSETKDNDASSRNKIVAASLGAQADASVVAPNNSNESCGHGDESHHGTTAWSVTVSDDDLNNRTTVATTATTTTAAAASSLATTATAAAVAELGTSMNSTNEVDRVWTDETDAATASALTSVEPTSAAAATAESGLSLEPPPTDLKPPPPPTANSTKWPSLPTTTTTTATTTTTTRRTTARRHRVLVVGAGMAGLATANELQARGYEVLVVEARGRVGGRLQSSTLALTSSTAPPPPPPPPPRSSSSSSSPSTSAKASGNSKLSKPSAAAATTSLRKSSAAASGQPHPLHHPPQPSVVVDLDIGGALIHGVDGNPLYDLVAHELQLTTRAVSECLLLSASGWPIDVAEDERMTQAFNDCLTETFRRIELYHSERATTSIQPPPLSFTNSNEAIGALTSMDHGASDHAHHDNGGELQKEQLSDQDRTNLPRQSLDTTSDNGDDSKKPASTAYTDATLPFSLSPEASFGALFEQVCSERNVNYQTALFKWHQANLEVSCGAPLNQLGWQWNDDEPYGYDGDHVAVSSSWRAVCERLADPLDIVFHSPIQNIAIIHPPPSALTQESTIATNSTTQDTTDNHTANTNGADTTLTDATSIESTTGDLAVNSPPMKRPKLPPAPANLGTSKKRKRDGIFAPVVVPERFSRRLRGEDTNAPRRSVRSNKGTGIADRFTVDHSAGQYLRKQRSNDADQKKKNPPPDNDPLSDHPPDHTVVQVRLSSGVILQADAVVCTLPLAILKESMATGEVTFDPPLPAPKLQAIQRLGTGLLNKCALTFAKQFWQDSDFLGLADKAHSYLVLNAAKYTGKPVLLFMYGGAFAAEMEHWTDSDVVEDCLAVLRRMCGRELVSTPLDYHVTRWGKETYSRMSFTYVPPGVNGHAELQAMGSPIYDHTNQVPVLMFAGEHTTPFHPSTIHGAFTSGIREAYRLDCAIDPSSNDFLEFTEDDVYQKTFTVKRRGTGNSAAAEVSASERSNGAATLPMARTPSSLGTSGRTQATSLRYGRRGAAGVMQLRARPKTNVTLTSSPVAKRATPAKSSPTPPTHAQSASYNAPSPSRRSQRASAALASPPMGLNAVPAASANVLPNRTQSGSDSLGRDLAALESRMLRRALESYGADYEYIRTTTMPVHGSFAVQTALQIQQRSHRLLQKKGKVARKKYSNWQAWIAKEIVEKEIQLDETEPHPHRDKKTSSDENGALGTKLRSGRISKRPA
jgi:Flavin containing amine oxidoreductase/NAD(P)-binding Rossmann-like domain